MEPQQQQTTFKFSIEFWPEVKGLNFRLRISKRESLTGGHSLLYPVIFLERRKILLEISYVQFFKFSA
jgi:hypothetical protein